MFKIIEFEDFTMNAPQPSNSNSFHPLKESSDVTHMNTTVEKVQSIKKH